MKEPFRFHPIRMIACSMFLFASILFSCDKNPVNEDDPDTVTDIDGNEYPIVQIGDQLWMAENLKVTHYRNGDAIPNVTGNTEWSVLTSGAYCVYDNNASNTEIYGFLYNWYAVDDARNIAPEGWHVPTDEEWKELEMYLGMSQSEADNTEWRGTDEGDKLKEAGTSHWSGPNTGATNETGFAALGGGYRQNFGTFYNLMLYAIFMTSTQADGNYIWYRLLYFENEAIFRFSCEKQWGFSVRCLRD